MLASIAKQINAYAERDPVKRQTVAFNTPAFAFVLGPKLFLEHFGDMFQKLVRDESADVRSTVAAGFHEVLRVMGTKVAYEQRFDDLFVLLLNDDEPRVINGVLSNLEVCFEILLDVSAHEDAKAFKEDIVKTIVKAEERVRPVWRAHLRFFEKLHLFLFNFPGIIIHKKFMPLLMHGLKRCAKEIRRRVCLILGDVLQSLPNFAIREELHELPKALAVSKNSLFRVYYIEFCEAVSDRLSRSYFKSVYREALISLITDKCPNVLIKLYNVTPKMVRKINAEEKKTIELVESGIRGLAEKHPKSDVREAAQRAIDEMSGPLFKQMMKME